jgi:cell division protein FtsW
MLALSVTGGMLLALTRWRPDPTRLKRPRLVATIDDATLSGHTRSR